MSDRKNKAYIPWHERIDKDLIQHLAEQFVVTVRKLGGKVNHINVKWEGNKFELDAEIAQPLEDREQLPDEPNH